MFLAHNLPRPRMPSGAPIFWRINLLQPIELPNRLQPSINELPSARSVFGDFAMLFGLAATRTIEHSLRAPGNGANAAEVR